MLTRSRSSPPLQRFVSHYWLSLDSTESTHAVFPDGAVDLVIKVRGTSSMDLIYGTTTTRTDAVVEPGSHYLGIRFKPGQSRHFISAGARELTDTCERAQGLLLFGLEDVPERVADRDVFARLDAVLERHVAR